MFDGEVLLASVGKGERRCGGSKCHVSVLDRILCVQRWLDWKPRALSVVRRDRETPPYTPPCDIGGMIPAGPRFSPLRAVESKFRT